MLVALMAIIDLGKMKITAVTRWLWLALSGGMFVAAPLACEDTNEPESEDFQLLYGPPLDVPLVDEGEYLDLQTLYGPPPDYLDQDTLPPPTDEGQIDDIQVLYGPPPDYLDQDTQPPPTDEGQYDDIQTLYGPPPDLSPYDPGQEDLNIQPMYGAVDVAPDSN